MSDQAELAVAKRRETEIDRPSPTALSILDSAIRGGINKDNVEVVERLVALRREELKEESKKAFARDWFRLRKNMPEIYADKAARNDAGEVVYTYCSEKEIADKLDPIMLQYGFTTLCGQRQEEGRVVAIITLMHEAGHEETREYSVRAGATNRMKDASAADAGSTTTAWRHLMIKLFGLKCRIAAGDDPRNEGGKVTPDQAFELERRVAETNSNKDAFLKLAGAKSFGDIHELKYDMLDQFLRLREKKGK